MNKDPLWDLVSQFVRQSNADEYGYVRCFTCGKRMRWQDSQGGHGIGRYHMATKYDLRNSEPQCSICNEDLRGNPIIYKLRMDEKHGPGTWEELERLSKTVSKLSRSDREQMIEDFKQRIKQLKRA